MERVGPFTLFINANVALLLNVAVVFLIGCASSLVLTLSGTSSRSPRSSRRPPRPILALRKEDGGPAKPATS